DLKTPIQRVAVHLDDLARAVPEGTREAALVDKVQAEVEGISATFHARLQLAQVEGGSARARFAPVEPAPLRETLGEVYEPTAAARGQHLCLSRPEGTMEVRGDRTLLGQMVSNLIENALIHTAEASRVELCVDRSDGQTRLRVSDNGRGIPPEERDKVLQRL